jgi:hypothetical protein
MFPYSSAQIIEFIVPIFLDMAYALAQRFLYLWLRCSIMIQLELHILLETLGVHFGPPLAMIEIVNVVLNFGLRLGESYILLFHYILLGF